MSKIYTKENITRKFNSLYNKYSSYTQNEIRFVFNELTPKEQKLLLMIDLEASDKYDRELVYKKIKLKLDLNRRNEEKQELLKGHIMAKITKYKDAKIIHEDYHTEEVLIYKDLPIIKNKSCEATQNNINTEQDKIQEKPMKIKTKKKKKKNNIIEKQEQLKLSPEIKESITRNLYDKYIKLDSEELEHIKELVDENIDKYYFEYKNSNSDNFNKKLYVSSKLNILIELFISKRYKQLTERLEKISDLNEKENITNKLLSIEILFIENNQTTYNLLNKLSNKISEKEFEEQLEDAMFNYSGEEKFSIYLVKRIKQGKKL